MERPTLPDIGNTSFRPIEPVDVTLGMEVLMVAFFASGAMASHQGHVQSYGASPEGGFFIHLRGTPFNLDPPYPVQAYVWEIQTWDKPAPTLSRAIEKTMSDLAGQIRRVR
jgi:hypothetical protein